MGKEIAMFGEIEFEKHTFHQHKSPVSIGDVDINKIILSYKVPLGKKKVLNILLVTKMIEKLNRCM